MIDPLDRRRNAVRDDLVDARLADRVTRPRYATARPMAVTAPVARCHMAPGEPAVDTEFLFGEPVDLFEEADGWAWVQSTVDAYVGYVPAATLGARGAAPTHVVSVPSAVAYEEATIKRAIRGTLPLGAAVHAAETVETSETFLRVGPGSPLAGAFVLVNHLRPVDAPPPADWVALAEMFVGSPYVWGGKTWGGIDCSGLVQLALQAAGRAAPRDSDMQAAELGVPLAADAPLQRGDLIFWKGHVGIMLDPARLLHANGHHMMTAIEPLAEAVARLDGKGIPVTLRRRP